MRALLCSVLFGTVTALSATPGSAYGTNDRSTPVIQGNAKYPCDVFSYVFCFRKPYGAVVTQRSGPDFEIYQVQGSDAQPLFSVYVGTIPERESDSAVRLKKFKVRGIDVTVNSYRDTKESKAVELRISYPTGVKVHAFGASDAAARMALADVLLNFRVCSKRGFTSVECETTPLFDADFAETIQQLD
ncbi:hypothetical protein [Pseudoxanthomonas wuyuanensis]|uniref:hypothetical protein n=1 Tax=Pseudoxanthomonas wuyuanensis TaxID=1073196 RepID=UPI001144AABE|nr:hypothetical protein [Pseudoxanthomonas wuyuanensis]